MDFSDHNSLIILYLSHGDENGLLHAKTGVLHTNEIWEPFSENESLKDKPKFFVFQVRLGTSSSCNVLKILFIRLAKETAPRKLGVLTQT